MAEIRVSLVLENAYDAIAARSGRAAAAAVRRVETIGVIDMGNDRAATPLCVPEDVVRRLGLEEGERAHSRFPGHALTPTGVMAIRCKQFHLPDL